MASLKAKIKIVVQLTFMYNIIRHFNITGMAGP